MTTHLSHCGEGKRAGVGAVRAADAPNPNNAEAHGQVWASAADVETVVTSAVQAQRQWAAWSPQRRAQVVTRFIDPVNNRIEKLARLLSPEDAKTHKGDIQRGAEIIGFAVGIPELLKDEFIEGTGTDIDVHSMRQPSGGSRYHAVQLPAMIPLRKAGPAGPPFDVGLRVVACGKRAQGFDCAENRMIVLPVAGFDLAAGALIGTGYGSAGRRCMAITAAREWQRCGGSPPRRRRPGVRSRSPGRHGGRRRVEPGSVGLPHLRWLESVGVLAISTRTVLRRSRFTARSNGSRRGGHWVSGVAPSPSSNHEAKAVLECL